jgi:surface antigen
MSSSGYAEANRTMYWRMYAGHNCTNYAAYRMIQSGLPDTRPWSGGGNATYWGTSMGSITDKVPAVGSIAWWKAGVSPAGASGHVAYVEEVVSADEIIVSQDSWGGDFSWARVTRESRGWPSGFIHFNDQPLVNDTRPVISGTAKVGARLTASVGSWRPADVTATYEWRMGARTIPGATGPRLRLTEETVGRRIKVVVTASRLGHPPSQATSVWTARVLPGALTGSEPPTVSGDPRVDSPLTATAGAWRPAPDSVSYQWAADGAPLAGADEATLVPGPELLGAALSVTVTAHRDGYADVATTVAVGAPVAAATLDVSGTPQLTGAPRPGGTLQLSATGRAPGAASRVEWLRAGVPVPGATGQTYSLTEADLGSRISVRQTLTRAGYTDAVLGAPPTARVKAVPDVRVATSPGARRVRITATATTAGAPVPSGRVRIWSDGRRVAEARLRDGSATAVVRGLDRGRRTFDVVLSATRTTTRVATVASVRVG